MAYIIGRTIIGDHTVAADRPGLISFDSDGKGESSNSPLPAAAPLRRTAGTSPLRSALPQRSAEALDPFRIRAPHKVQSLLKRLLNGSVLVTLSVPSGKTYITMVWAVDPVRDIISLAADAGNARAQDILNAGQVTAVAYLDGVKQQFDLPGLELLLGRNSGVFSASLPREVCLFQRRNWKRAQPVAGTLARARMRHPDVTQGHIMLRVMDIGVRGVALTLPSHVPALQPGTLLQGVELDLEAGGRVTVDLQVQHVTGMNPGNRGARVGCEVVDQNEQCKRAMERNFEFMSQRTRRPMP